jgi:hypothetical protein
MTQEDLVNGEVAQKAKIYACWHDNMTLVI